MYSGCGIRRYLCLIFAILLAAQGVDLLRCKCSKGRECFRNGTCETEGVCFTLTHLKHSTVTTDYGCFHPDILHPVGNPMVCHSNEMKAHRENRKCCKSRDYCNAEHVNHPTLAPLPSATLSQENKILIGIIVLVAVIFFSLLVVIICWHRTRSAKLLKNESDVHLIPSTPTETKIDISFSQNSGSGSGLPLFMPITIARQISLDTIVGTGRYGEVWRGVWRGDFVAVKIFHSREERSWSREAQIYQTVMLRHENILGFIAADNKDNGTWTQLWLVTDYYPHGSLFDYLNSTVINMEVMLQMLLSIANGLAHLHMEIIGTQGKPGIAHRDLKSKNILVKNNLQCCIADLGLAVKHDSELDKVDIASNNRVGTVRYMAPEIIQDLIDPDKFVGFKQADIYSLALVFWEILRRCDHFGPPEEYQLPYYDCVPSDPTHEEMLKAVVTDEKRPTIPREWRGNKTYEGVINVMCECWSGYPSVRVEALRIKKSLMKIIDNYNVMLQPAA